ncbi:MAG TPA: hypothetical protein VHN78_00620, partial [Chloroflexota bacterium]|nr:hypothetical protein [Chloroflexota bacterium]
MGEETRAGDHPIPGRSQRSLDPGGGPGVHPIPGRSQRSLDPGGGPGVAVLGLGLLGASLC